MDVLTQTGEPKVIHKWLSNKNQAEQNILIFIQ